MVTFRWILCCLLLIYSAVVNTAPQLYRCVDAEGRSTFQQAVCQSGKQSSVILTDRRIGWVPPKVVKNEAKVDKKKRPKKRADSVAKEVREQRKHDQSCWRAEQNLEQTERKLRRGYKVGMGNRLRAQQARYESYLKEFC